MDARENSRWPHVGVLVEGLADREPQPPQCDMIRHFGHANRTEVNGVKIVQSFEPIFRHQDGVLLVVVGTPIEGFRCEGEASIDGGASMKYFETDGDDFLSDPIARNGGDFIVFHITR